MHALGWHAETSRAVIHDGGEPRAKRKIPGLALARIHQRSDNAQVAGVVHIMCLHGAQAATVKGAHQE